MLVNFKRDHLGPGGVYYKKGTREYNGDPELLPRTAVVVSENGSLPVQSNSPKPGFGAKPLEEQALDLIPGASPTHQIDVTSTPTPPPLTEEERKTREAEAEKARAEDRKEDEKAEEELKKETEQGLKNAEKAVKKITEATDPLEDILSPTKPKK